MSDEMNLKKGMGIRGVINVVFSVIAAFSITLAVECMVCLSNLYTIIDEYVYNYSISSEVPESLMKPASEMWSGLAILVGIILISIGIITITSGRKGLNGKIELKRYENVFTDVVILIMLTTGTFGVLASLPIGSIATNTEFLPIAKELPGATTEFIEYIEMYAYGGRIIEPQWVPVAACMLAGFICALICVYCYKILVNKIKTHNFFGHTIIGKIALNIYDALKKNPNVLGKLMAVSLIGCIVSATWFGTLPVIIAICIFIPKYARKYTAVRDGVRELKNGNLNYKVPVTGNGELDRFAEDINELSGSVSKAVENELKSQRMKTDLITNVSHDLRTPLTSMVSYVDLLKSEGLESENAPEYLRIIDEKTKRLQKLTDDLFAAAKASSGAINLNVETIDMCFIANQALAEMEEKLMAAKLNVVFNCSCENTSVMADGQQLWRVIENLLVNVSKYALSGSRVYMDISDSSNFVKLEIKNISRDQLNINPDELMERFKRGDDSRNTEGSGLGLAIAKDLTHLMNGQLEITIDGDLFKAIVLMPRS